MSYCGSPIIHYGVSKVFWCSVVRLCQCHQCSGKLYDVVSPGDINTIALFSDILHAIRMDVNRVHHSMIWGPIVFFNNAQDFFSFPGLQHMWKYPCFVQSLTKYNLTLISLYCHFLLITLIVMHVTDLSVATGVSGIGCPIPVKVVCRY